jgi:hypothetical protein
MWAPPVYCLPFGPHATVPPGNIASVSEVFPNLGTELRAE